MRLELTIETTDRPGNAPAAVRLRRCFKAMLRSFGLRCESIEPAGDEASGSDGNGSTIDTQQQ